MDNPTKVIDLKEVQQQNNCSDLSNLLSAYGYKSTKKQLAIVSLLYFAGCFDQAIFTHDLQSTHHQTSQIEHAIKIAEKATQNYHEPKNLQVFNANLMLEKLFPQSNNHAWPETLHQWLIQVTQRYFFARNAGQERWQPTKTTELWLNCYGPVIQAISQELGLDDEVSPMDTHYAAIAVFGSAEPEMENRLNYAKNLVDVRNIHAKQLFLLSGERFASTVVDGNETFLQQIAAINKINVSQVTETQLMQYAYHKVKNTSTGHFANLLVTVINAPRGNKTRPNTIDTLIELSKVAAKLTGKVLFVSGAPNIQAQAEDTLATLKDYLPNVQPEIVGDHCHGATINRVIEGFADELFGGFVRVALNMGSQKSANELRDKRNQFSYSMQQKI